MLERLRQCSDDFKTEILPQTDRAGIAGHDKIELHSAKAVLDGKSLRVSAHFRSNPAPARFFADDIAAIGDVLSAAALIRSDEIRAEKLAGFVFGDKRRKRRINPKSSRLGFSDIACD